MRTVDDHAAELTDKGFTIVPDFFRQSSILEEIEFEVDAFGKELCGPDFSFDHYDAALITREVQSLIYDRLKYLVGLPRLSSAKPLIEMLQQLGLRRCSLMGCDNMRFDPPHQPDHLFDWHQDTLYLLGSLNAVTVWVPFGRVDEHHGTIEVAIGSHKKGIFPYKRISDKPIEPYVPFLQRDLSLDYDVNFPTEIVTADRGDLVIFNQMALHRSLPNYSDKPRWTAQIRVSDLSCDWFQKSRFPMGDRTNIFYCDYPGFKHPESKI